MLSPEILAVLRLSYISIGIGLLCLVKLLAFAQIYLAWKLYNRIYQQMKLRYQKPYKNAPNLCSACGDCLAKEIEPEESYDTELIQLPCGHFIHAICAENLEYKAKCFYCEVTFFTYMIDWKQKPTLPYHHMMKFYKTTRLRMQLYKHVSGVSREYRSIRRELEDLTWKDTEGGKVEWYMTVLPWIMFKSHFSYDELVPKCKSLRLRQGWGMDNKRKRNLIEDNDDFDKLRHEYMQKSKNYRFNSWIENNEDIVKREIWKSQRFNY